ncbi:MAG: hypothetical protein ACLFVR_12770 [Thiohalospira sp.]
MLKNFKRNVELLENTEIIQTPVEVFKSIVKRRVDDINNTMPIVTKEPITTQTKSVYFIHSNTNEPGRQKIINYLKSNDFEIYELKEEKNKIDLIKQHQKYLINADAILIYYVSENFYWLKSKLNDLKKAPGFGKKEPFLAKAILTNKVTNLDLNNEIEDILMIDQGNKDISACLIPFTEKIK